jgi:hypothetical protein
LLRKRSRISFVIGSSLVTAITIAFIVSNYLGPTANPEPPYLTVTSPERLPPDPNKPNGAEVRYTDVHVFEVVKGGGEKAQR